MKYGSMRSLLGLLTCAVLPAFLAGAPACSSTTHVNGAAPAGTEEEQDDDGGTAPSADPQNPVFVELDELTAGKDVAFDIPKGALGFNITIEGAASEYDPDAPFGIDRVVDPKGNVIHDKYTPKGGSKPTSVAIFDTIASVSVPQGEGAPTDLAGKWKLRVGQFGLATSSVKLKGRVRIQSSGDGTFHGGKLDLHLHVPDTLRIDDGTIQSSEAENHPGMKRRLDGFFALTSSLLGIERGNVVWHTATSRLASIDTVDKLLAGFAVSRGTTTDGTQALHILFTNRIAIEDPAGDGINALGVAPGIPGSALTFGRGVSGIIVATTSGVQEDVLTMIHEAGHFFGLNHTTELQGGGDPLSDTPLCANIDPHDLGACPDLSNVMFVAGAQAPNLDGVTLTASQKRVYRGSPIYKAFNSGAPRTMSLRPGLVQDPVMLGPLRRHFRHSDGPLSPIENELSLGFCGLTKIDGKALARKYGEPSTIAQLQAAAVDADLAPFIRGRATAALRSLGVK